MSTALTSVGVLFSALAVLAAILQFLDIVWDRQDKERIKQRILDFWIKTSDLAFMAQVSSALEARYARTRSLRGKFITLFWIFCGVVICVASIETLWIKSDDLRASYSATLKINFDADFSIRCAYSMVPASPGSNDVAERCNPTNESNSSPEFVSYRITRDKFLNFVSQCSPTSLLLSQLTSGVISVLIVGLPATVALLISLNLTLWILSRITQSRIKFVFLVLFDIFVAAWMPPFLTSLMIMVVVAAEVLISGQIFSIATFSEPSWLALTVGSSLLQINITFWFLSIAFLVISVFPAQLAAILTALAFLDAPLVMAALRVETFVADVVKVFEFDFSTDLIQATIDYAIFTDLLFSAFYLCPCFLIVVANRNDRFRNMFLNLIMWVGDHAKGPFVAVSELASLVFSIFKYGRR